MAMENPERLISPKNFSEVSEQNRVVVCAWTTEGPWDFINDKKKFQLVWGNLRSQNFETPKLTLWKAVYTYFQADINFRL